MTPPPPYPAIPEPRDLRFDLSDVPKFWHGGRKSVSIFFDNLSLIFPPGERFFVNAVKSFQGQVEDPVLRAEMKAFCAQEGHHSREHVRYNQMLAHHGFPAAQMEARIARFLGAVAHRVSKVRQLGITCALEHFTALLAWLVLQYPRLLDGAHPKMAALWRWHAAEEIEHKAVAFDVYQAVGGSLFRRGVQMILTTLFFWGWVLRNQVELMRSEGILWSVREWFQLIDFLFLHRGSLFQLGVPYFRYFGPRFHPGAHDTRPLLERWKAGPDAQPQRS